MNSEIITYSDDDRFGLAAPVYVLDDLTVKAGAQSAMLSLMSDQYLPLARERNMELVGVWLFPPFERLDEPADVVYLWRFDSLRSWWAARAVEENDARLPAFWKQAEPLLMSRTRRLGRTPSLMTGTEPDQGCVRAIVPPPAGSRHIAIVEPLRALSDSEQASWVADAERIEDVNGVELSRAGFHVEHSFLPGQMTWDVVTGPDTPVTPALLLARLPGQARVTELVTLDAALDMGMRDPVGRVAEKRTILFRVGDVSDAHQQLLEETLMQWARQLDGLRSWSLSRLTRVEGSTAWTHCFEQEFDDHRVATTEYLEHPYHWSVADRFFGPEGPEKAVYEFLHTMRASNASMLHEVADLTLHR